MSELDDLELTPEQAFSDLLRWGHVMTPETYDYYCSVLDTPTPENVEELARSECEQRTGCPESPVACPDCPVRHYWNVEEPT